MHAVHGVLAQQQWLLLCCTDTHVPACNQPRSFSFTHNAATSQHRPKLLQAYLRMLAIRPLAETSLQTACRYTKQGLQQQHACHRGKAYMYGYGAACYSACCHLASYLAQSLYEVVLRWQSKGMTKAS